MYGGLELLKLKKFSLQLILENATLLFPVLMALIAAHGLWRSKKWAIHVSQFTLGLIAFPSFKFLMAHLTFTAGLANFVFPLIVILFLLLIFV